MNIQTRSSRRCGAAAVELAILSPLLITILAGLWEVGRLVEVQQLLNNAAREGARQAATGDMTLSQVQTVVINYLQVNGINNVTTSNITFSDLTTPTITDPSLSNQLDQLQVTVSIPFSSVRWILLNQMTNTKNLSATATWYSMADLPLNLSVSMPTY